MRSTYRALNQGTIPLGKIRGGCALRSKSPDSPSKMRQCLNSSSKLEKQIRLPRFAHSSNFGVTESSSSSFKHCQVATFVVRQQSQSFQTSPAPNSESFANGKHQQRRHHDRSPRECPCRKCSKGHHPDAIKKGGVSTKLFLLHIWSPVGLAQEVSFPPNFDISVRLRSAAASAQALLLHPFTNRLVPPIRRMALPCQAGTSQRDRNDMHDATVARAFKTTLD